MCKCVVVSCSQENITPISSDKNYQAAWCNCKQKTASDLLFVVVIFKVLGNIKLWRPSWVIAEIHHASSTSARSQEWHEKAWPRLQRPRNLCAVILDSPLAIAGRQVEEEPLWLCGRRERRDKGRHAEGGTFSGKLPINFFITRRVLIIAATP